MKSQFKVGERVTVYERPFSAEKEEGEATLVEFLYSWDDGAERWGVEFDEDPGMRVERTIVPEEYQQKDPEERDWMARER